MSGFEPYFVYEANIPSSRKVAPLTITCFKDDAPAEIKVTEIADRQSTVAYVLPTPPLIFSDEYDEEATANTSPLAPQPEPDEFVDIYFPDSAEEKFILKIVANIEKTLIELRSLAQNYHQTPDKQQAINNLINDFTNLNAKYVQNNVVTAYKSPRQVQNSYLDTMAKQMTILGGARGEAWQQVCGIVLKSLGYAASLGALYIWDVVRNNPPPWLTITKSAHTTQTLVNQALTVTAPDNAPNAPSLFAKVSFGLLNK